ncbi:hypothetical protein CSA37_03420 [Candidatus Fermentibacteria bacterium]|nr:MAG: hypothetical protein CSA37_03420 [Candidatus Fermentibacteria bacterium]
MYTIIYKVFRIVQEASQHIFRKFILAAVLLPVITMTAWQIQHFILAIAILFSPWSFHFWQ